MSFKYNYTLYKHQRAKHNIYKVKAKKTPFDLQNFEQQGSCKKVLKKNLNWHLKSVHGVTPKQIMDLSLLLRVNKQTKY